MNIQRGLAALIVIVTFLPVGSYSEPTHPNEIGLYMTPDGFGATGTDVVWGPVDVYLVLTKPSYLESNSYPWPAISDYEFALNFAPVPPISTLFYGGSDLPPYSLDWITEKDILQGVLEFYIHVDHVPVVDDQIVLATLHFFVYEAMTFSVMLGPVSAPRIDGQMCFETMDGELRIMHPVSGSLDAPVFMFGGEAVNAESMSFDSVKALYR